MRRLLTRSVLLFGTLAAVTALAPVAASAQVYLPTAGGICTEPDFYDGRPGGFGYNGYLPHGYIDGLLVHVVHTSRYDGDWPDEDEDWNFILRPVDKAACPDGQRMMGRDCKRARELYVDLIWGNSQWEWRSELIDVLKMHGDFAGLTSQERSLLVGSSGDHHTLAAEQVERKLWASIMLDPDRFNSFYWNGNGYSASHYVLEGEVAISTDSAGDELGNPNTAGFIANAQLQDQCADHPDGNYPHGCDIRDALFYGTITTDLNHDEGKVEMHPIRAIVTNDDRVDLYGKDVFKSANPPITTTVRAFADYGKAGDGGSGSIAGRICEHWLQNRFDPQHQLPRFPPFARLNGGAYRSYVTITSDAFEFPKVESPGPGKAAVVERACAVRTLLGIRSHGTAGGLGVSVEKGDFTKGCPGFAADPNYIGDDDNMQRLIGGWWVSEFVTRNKYEGHLTLTATQKSDKPVAMGVIHKGDELEHGVKAPSTARYYRVVVQAEAKLVTGDTAKPLAIDKLDALTWEVSANVVKAPQGNGIIHLYLPVAPEKDKDLDRYKLAAVAVSSYQHQALTSNKLIVSIPRPRVTVKATYALDVKAEASGKQSLVYKPSFHATGSDFIEGGAAFTWTQGKTKVGTGASVTLSLTDADRDAKLRVEGADTAKGGPYEAASAKANPYIPETEVAAPGELQHKGGTTVASAIKRVGAVRIPCAGAAGLPAKGYAQVTLVGAMKIPKNPYKAPAPLAPVYTWGPVQVQAGDSWTKVATATTSGTGNDTLTLTLDNVQHTDDLVALSQFRVRLAVVDGYGRKAETLVHFTNWDASDAVKATTACFDDRVARLSNIPKYDWGKTGIKDPVNDPPDVTRDQDQPLRDPVLLSRLRTLYDSSGNGTLAARATAPDAAPAPASKPARAMGGTAIFEGIERAKKLAPALR
jgi:hypothetical protein